MRLPCFCDLKFPCFYYERILVEWGKVDFFSLSLDGGNSSRY